VSNHCDETNSIFGLGIKREREGREAFD